MLKKNLVDVRSGCGEWKGWVVRCYPVVDMVVTVESAVDVVVVVNNGLLYWLRLEMEFR